MAEETSWRSGRSIWASAPGAYQVASVKAGDFQSLLVHFPSGVEAFQQLIAKPNLFARVSIDRSAGLFIGVNFDHR
jgi:hypothetical protein